VENSRHVPLLQMQDIDKSFYGVKVLDQVCLDLDAGEVLALVGENGAGKSTLIKILNGDYRKDSGTILLDGQPVQIDQPRDAEHFGIRMIYQELHYAPDLSVAENLLLGHLPRRGGLLGQYIVDWDKANSLAREYLQMLKVDIDPRALMGNLSVVEREIVEIVKALSARARIIVMDEPTAALTPNEVDLLFNIIRQLCSQGVGIIYISHRLDEVFQIAERVTVLRDGRLVGTRSVRELRQRELVQMMVGRDVAEARAADRSAPADAPPVLSVSGLTSAGDFENINLQVQAGEIVGIFGLLGAGHGRLLLSLFGAYEVDGGTVTVNGVPVSLKSPEEAQKAGIGLVPIDRKGQGLVLDMNVRENVTLSNWRAIARAGFLNARREKQNVSNWIERLGIRMGGGMETKIRFLSGGNQQKTMLARWLEANVKVLLLNEPTWGVDVGARSDIYDQLETLAKHGLAILMASSDLNEVLSISDRILTICKGRLTGEFRRAEASREVLLHAAAGGEA
jgi:ribose transport system ATP-binding protein